MNNAPIAIYRFLLKKMDPEYNFCRGLPWQANLPCLSAHLGDKWQMSSNISGPREPRKLTTEATFVLCVILFFVLLSIIGSSINAFDSFCKAFLKKKTSPTLKDQKEYSNGETQVETEMKFFESSKTSVRTENWRTFFDCFCIQTNARKVLAINQSKEHLNFVDGMRALFFLLIFGAHFFHFLSASIKNIDNHIDALLQFPITRFTRIAGFSVDGFFILSGFLTGYLFSNYFEKTNGKINWIAFYAYRFIRITPVYMIALGFYTTLFTYMSSSPVWPTYDSNPVCKETWIWNLIYLNNFIPGYKQCYVSNWFLASLMQLYVISPLFLVPLNRSPRIGYFLIGATICFSCFMGFSITRKHDIYCNFVTSFSVGRKKFYSELWKYMEFFHQNTFVRLTPYLIGILLGYHLHKRKLIKKNNLLTLTIGWISSGVLISVAFFTFYNKEATPWESAIYHGVKSLLFSCGFAWVFFVCATQQTVFIGQFLCLRIFKPISRLSYCAFLTHFILLEGYFMSVEVPVDVRGFYEDIVDLSWVPIYFRLFLGSLLIAFVVFLLFEAPVSRLLNLYLIENRKKIVTNETKID